MGTFTRRVYLSEHLDAEAIEAAYDNGVLRRPHPGPGEGEAAEDRDRHAATGPSRAEPAKGADERT